MASLRASLNVRAQRVSSKRSSVKAQAVLPKNAGLSAAAFVAAAIVAAPAGALTYDEFQGLTYLQVKGTGLANTCPVIESSSADLKVKSGDYKFNSMCIEPTSFTVKEEDEFQKTKLMTRLTYTLDGLEGDFKVGSDGSVALKEKDGIDYAAVTVQLAGGERVPFLFSLKNLEAKGSLAQFGGDFDVPSYRGASFLDPKGRGATTGYDTAVGLQGKSDAEELLKENIKTTVALKGSAVFNVAKYDASTGEIAGVFESIQPSDTDLGAKAPKDVKVTGLWYARLS